MKVELVTQAEYARRRGVRPSAVTRAVKAGRITLIDGMVDPTVADVQWAQNSRTRAGSRPSTWAGSAAAGPEAINTSSDYFAARAARERAEAEMAALRVAEMKRDLVPADEMRRTLAAHFSGAREAVLQMPARLAPVIAAESDPAAVSALLDAELRAVLERLATLKV